MHKGTFIAGLIYAGLGVAFILEALGVWTISVRDLRLFGPLTLVLIGLVVILASVDRMNRQPDRPTLAGDPEAPG